MLIQVRSALLMLLLACSLSAWQLGRDTSSNRTLDAAVPDEHSCAGTLARQVWKISDPKVVRDTPAGLSDSLMQSRLSLECEKKTSPNPNLDLSLPILVSGTIWSVDDKKNFIEEAKESEVFVVGKHGVLQQVGTGSDGKSVTWAAEPALYGAPAVWFVGISCFIDRDSNGNLTTKDVKGVADAIKVSYSLTTTQVVPENITNLESVFSALAGLSASQNKGARPITFQCGATLVAAGKISGGRPPFDISLTMSVKPGSGKSADDLPQKSVQLADLAPLERQRDRVANYRPASLSRVVFKGQTDAAGSAPPGPQASQPGGNKAATNSDTGKPTSGDGTKDCSGALGSTGCSSTITVRSYDKEYWDLSMGIAIPGVLEPQYASANPAAPPTATRHTDFYAFLDLYPFAAVANKTSYAPHFSVGIPITGKPLYRPFFGLSENVTGWRWLQQRNFPFQMSALAGVVLMNQQIVVGNPNGSGLLIRHSRVLKPMYGVEISIGTLISKIKALGGGNSTSTTANGSGKGGTGSKGGSN
jgi:hypothetical protein